MRWTSLSNFAFAVLLLGHEWYPPDDTIIFKFPINLSKKNRTGQREDPDLSQNDISRIPHIDLTKRRLLGWVMSIYDPMGIMSPLTIKTKIALRQLFGGKNTNLGWDDPVCPSDHLIWEKLLAEFLKIDQIVVTRSVRPPYAFGLPELYGFFDGSLEAYSCCIYLRWCVSNDESDPGS